MKIKQWIMAALLFLSCVALTGCEQEIFQDKNAKYRLNAVDDDDLVTNVYYVKDGTKFYQVHELSSSSAGIDLDVTKCAWSVDDETLIPSYFRNELLAYASSKVDTAAIRLERYKDCGYSIGVYGAAYEDGYISFQASSNTIKKTQARNAFDNDKSNYILIETINGSPVNETMLNEAGMITGMEEGGAYEITYYAGTYYGTATVKADTHFFQSYEMYSLDDIDITKNGYVSIKLPSDLECGYYNVNGAGFFKYYNFKKAEGTTEDVDYNIAYFESEEDQILAYSQQFVFNLDYSAANMSVKATFDPKSVTNASGNVKMMLTTPDGRHMTVDTDKSEGEIMCDMSESMPGKWTVNITPQSMSISDVQIVSNELEAEATKEVYNLTFEQDMTGVVFTMEYEGKGDVTAQITDGENKSYDMVPVSETIKQVKHSMQYSFAYLPAGEYQVNVFHYPDTRIIGVDYHLSEDVRDVEIITVEE